MSDCRGLNEDGGSDVDRRAFLGTGAGAVTAAALLGQTETARAQDQPAAKASALIPKRVLGKTGVEVSMLNLGTWKSVGLDRILRLAWSRGLRYIDTAASYGSEPAIGRWMKENPGVRKDLFLVTKDGHANTPKDLIAGLDKRLEQLQTDYIDLIFIHALGDSNIDKQIEWPKSREFKETAEAIRKSGKAKFVGFSCHHPRQAEILQNAAEGGFVDAIMVRNSSWANHEAPFDKALDACHKAGIGLISMKQIAGNTKIDDIAALLPELKEKGLTPYQGLLHAIWTDERFSSVCVSMRNTDQVRENTDAAQRFKPMTKAEISRLRDACLAAGPTFCAACDGSCSRAGGTDAELGTLTRLLTYHDHHGYREEARRQYADLRPEARDWTGADLAAAREACHSKLDFADLLARVEKNLA
ncbi:aldo/keto reductase [Paludisphaera borealis]|uniref:L-glyceraldehyde 3-phosphate reductase n=1 Tax=Paludisphaera borealis TaxID=1387353 RepID=A0A1U7CU41_9BACT|nr:aldo/keto reductase [Paludisphaera borealis]APW62470.1 L-glyceraldehyde 3-phosphate reductase [Paludisphaera borealis]